MSKSDRKPRNAQAVGAWSRHGDAHSPGSKRPELNESEEVLAGLGEALDEALDDAVRLFVEGYIEIDGELIEIEIDWNGEDDDESEE